MQVEKVMTLKIFAVTMSCTTKVIVFVTSLILGFSSAHALTFKSGETINFNSDANSKNDDNFNTNSPTKRLFQTNLQDVSQELLLQLPHLNFSKKIDDITGFFANQENGHLQGYSSYKEFSEAIKSDYKGANYILNQNFDFSHLQITREDLNEQFYDAAWHSEGPDNYEGMLYYGAQGDFDGSGNPQLAFTGWTTDKAPDGNNNSVRLYLLTFDETGMITKSDWVVIEGTAAPWVSDFDNDGIDELFTVGFYDFPVKPAPSYYFNNGLKDRTEVGPWLDSHESTMVDYDKDGDLDILAVTYNNVNGYLSLYTNDNGAFSHSYIKPKNGGKYLTSGSSIAVGNINGKSDIIIVGDAGRHGGFEIINPKTRDDRELNVRPYFERKIFHKLESNFCCDKHFLSHDINIQLTDIDFDGDLDIISSASLWAEKNNMGVYQILINNGKGKFRDETDKRLFNWSITKSASHDTMLVDVNGDGFLDILGPDGGGTAHHLKGKERSDYLYMTDGNAILLNDGTGHYLNITTGTFNMMAMHNFIPKWVPLIHDDGRITFTALIEKAMVGDRFLTATLDRPLSTGPNFIDPATMGLPGFNEFYVLRHDETALKAVTNGDYGSALEWYLKTNSDGHIFAPGAHVKGSQGDDIITLREGDERAFGGPGADVLNGMEGTDILVGGAGADTFVHLNLNKNSHDFIYDFNPIEGDKLDIRGFGIAGFEDLTKIVNQVEGNLLLQLNNTSKVELRHFGLDELEANKQSVLLH